MKQRDIERVMAAAWAVNDAMPGQQRDAVATLYAVLHTVDVYGLYRKTVNCVTPDEPETADTLVTGEQYRAP